MTNPAERIQIFTHREILPAINDIDSRPSMFPWSGSPPTCFSLFPPILISYSPASQCNPVCDIGGWCSLLEIIHGSTGGRRMPYHDLGRPAMQQYPQCDQHSKLSSPTRILTTTPDRPPANSPPMTNEYSPLRGLIVCNGVGSTSPSIHQRVSHQKLLRAADHLLFSQTRKKFFSFWFQFDAMMGTFYK